MAAAVASATLVVSCADLAQSSVFSLQTITDGADTYTAEMKVGNVPALSDNHAGGVQLTCGTVTPCPPRNTRLAPVAKINNKMKETFYSKDPLR